MAQITINIQTLDLDNGGDRRLALDAEERQQGKNRLGRWKGTGRDRQTETCFRKVGLGGGRSFLS